MNFKIFETLNKGWALLRPGERQHAVFVLCVVLLSAVMSALMVGSVFPFLSVLSNPDLINENSTLGALYRAFSFDGYYDFLVALGVASLAVILSANVLLVFRLYVVVSFAMGRMHSISTRLLSSYLRQPYGYFLKQHTGELGTQILSESQQVVQYFYRPVAELVSSGFTIIAIVLLLIWVNWVVALLSLGIGGGLYVSAYLLSRRFINRQGGIRAEENKQRFKISNEVLGGVKEIKLLGREKFYHERYTNSSLKVTRAESNVAVWSQLPLYIMQVIAFGGMILLSLALLDPQKNSHTTSLGEILPLLGLLAFAGQRLVPELSKFYAGLTQLNYGAALIGGVFRDLGEDSGSTNLPSPDTKMMPFRTSLELIGITYSYPDTERAALQNVSLEISAGERIGIVGSSGSGKTTLADTIMCLLTPQHGSILVDGVEIDKSRTENWQRSVGYVQQSVFLADGTVLENIALGLPAEQVDRERAIEAGRTARLDEFVNTSLPDGYDSAVGERGVRLSGGQRQRIAIARALYNDAELIVFDEATSALDNLTERQVMASIDALPRSKTVVVIAHRLSTLENCDRLVVMNEGQVVGIGTRAELAKSNVYFQSLSTVT